MAMDSSRLFEISQFMDDFCALPQWPISSYAPSKNLPVQLLEGCDQQPEEIRLLYYIAGNNGVVDAAHEEISNLVKATQEKIKTIETHLSQATNYINIVQKSSHNKYNSVPNAADKPPTFFEYLKSQKDMGQAVTSGARPQSNLVSTSSAFAQPTTSAFGQPAFGQVNRPAFGQGAFGTSPLGQNSQIQSAFGQTSSAAARPAFGKPAFGQSSSNQTSAFGQNISHTSLFGQASSAFIKPAFGASTFGQSVVNPTSTPSSNQTAFGQSSSTQSVFGQGIAAQPAFGQAKPVFGQSSYNEPAFGQPVFGQAESGRGGIARAAFGQPAFGKSSFGQSQNGNGPFSPNSTVSPSNTSSAFIGQTALQPAFGTQSFGQAAHPQQSGTTQENLAFPAFGGTPGLLPAFGRPAFGQPAFGQPSIVSGSSISPQPVFGQALVPAFGVQTQANTNAFTTPPQTKPSVNPPTLQPAFSTGQTNAPFGAVSEKSSNIYQLVSEDTSSHSLGDLQSQPFKPNAFPSQINLNYVTLKSGGRNSFPDAVGKDHVARGTGKSGILQSFQNPWQRFNLDRIQRGDFQIEPFNDDPENQIQFVHIERYRSHRFGGGQIPLVAPTREVALGIV